MSSSIKYAYLKQQTWLYRRNYPKDLQPILGAALNVAIIFGWLGALTAEQIIAIEGLIAAVLGTTIRAGIKKAA